VRNYLCSRVDCWWGIWRLTPWKNAHQRRRSWRKSNPPSNVRCDKGKRPGQVTYQWKVTQDKRSWRPYLPWVQLLTTWSVLRSTAVESPRCLVSGVSTRLIMEMNTERRNPECLEHVAQAYHSQLVHCTLYRCIPSVYSLPATYSALTQPNSQYFCLFLRY
jgi:hypothetical protein